MRYGVLLNMPAESERSDADVIHEHLKLGDMVEPLGFDSLFVLEHHFSSYVLSPAPFELLSYYAGRTQQILLGTAVIVLPWADPVRVAEQIAVLDIICKGRCIFAFGRGTAATEFAGFRVPMSQSRGRFLEAAKIVVGLLSNSEFSFEGEYYQIPLISIRPRAVSSPHERFYGAGMSRQSADTLAKLGFGMLLATQKPWAVLSDDIGYFNKIVSETGHKPPNPIVVASISADLSRDKAVERAHVYLSREWPMIDAHYQYSRGQLSSIPGYELYSTAQLQFAKLKNETYRSHATQEYLKSQVVGTPNDCIQQIQQLAQLTGTDHMLLEFSFGGMPFHEAEQSMKTFASEVLPVLKRDKRQSN